jgi:hypothetical protein
MLSPSRLCDSTQFVLPQQALDGIEDDLDEQFVVSVTREDDDYRIIGSPVEIKAVGEYLIKNGVSVR